MGSEQGLLGLAIAVVSAAGAVAVAWVGKRRDTPTEEVAVGPGGGLQVAPEIWADFQGRVSRLEGEVRDLQQAVEEKTQEVTRLERLLRMAMRIIRRANRRLGVVQEAAEEIPVELVPYSID